MTSEGVTIGEVAAATKVSVETIRHYEKKGLLKRPKRSKRGYRLYDDTVIARLQFIRRARELEFDLDDIRSLLRHADHYDDRRERNRTRELTQKHLHKIWANIEGLQRIASVLERGLCSCAEQDSLGCSIIEIMQGKHIPDL